MSDLKLIKLITNDNNAIFDNQFRNEIYIKPNSQIALHSVSMTREPAKIIIDDSNDKINFNIGGGDKQIILPHGSYNEHQIADLIDDICRNANRQLSIINGNIEHGAVIKTQIDASSPGLMFPQFIFELHRPLFTGLNTLDAAGFGDTNLHNCVVNGELIQKNTDTISGLFTSANMNWETPLIKGCGSYRVRINTLVDNVNPTDANGFIMGLTKSPEKLTDALNGFRLADVDFGLIITSTTVPYGSIKDGVMTPSAIQPVRFNNSTPDNTHDYLELQYNNGRMIGTVYQHPNLATEILNEPFLYPKESYINVLEQDEHSLFPFIIFFAGPSRVILDGVRYHPNKGFAEIVSPDIAIPDTTLPISNPAVAGTQTDLELNFNTQRLRKFFGFDRISNTITGAPSLPGFETILLSSQPFTVVDFSDIYMVELLNIPLDSYEGFSEQRKNILAVVPVNENNVNQQNFVLQYEASNQNFISIRNESTLSLRNIRARIVNSNMKPIDTDGLSHIVLLIKGPKE